MSSLLKSPSSTTLEDDCGRLYNYGNLNPLYVNKTTFPSLQVLLAWQNQEQRSFTWEASRDGDCHCHPGIKPEDLWGESQYYVSEMAARI
jgi:hypothetical protein